MTRSPATIRSYKPDDFAAVLRVLGHLNPWISLAYTATDWERVFETPLQGRETFVIETEGSVVGVGVLRQRFLFGDYLELLAIAESAQGQGYGRALLAHLESVVYRRAKKLFLCVFDFHHPAPRFFRREGYTGKRPRPPFFFPRSLPIPPLHNT